MLKDFYKAHNKEWLAALDANTLGKKLDSLERKYCTSKLREEAREWFRDGHDLLTNDWGTDANSLKGMAITKDPVRLNGYVVSYWVNTFPVSPKKPVRKRVELHVLILIEAGIYKIASVK